MNVFAVNDNKVCMCVPLNRAVDIQSRVAHQTITEGVQSGVPGLTKAVRVQSWVAGMTITLGV